MLILYSFQEQGIAGHGLASITTPFALNHPTEIIERQAAASHLYQSAHNRSHHVAKKPVGRDFKIPAVSRCLVPLSRRDFAQSGLHVGMRLTESAEVLIIFEYGSRIIHQLEVKRIVQLARVCLKEWRLTRMYIIMVRAQRCREAGMHPVFHLLSLLNGNILWKKFVQLISQLLCIKLALIVEMSHHHASMHTCIRPAGSCHTDLLPKQKREATLQFCLHRDAVGLYLPAMIACAIVAQGDEISHDSTLFGLQN